MSDLLPLFPLPNVVLFPNVFLPLHIFEPRYRDMVAEALASDRLIGMVLLRPGRPLPGGGARRHDRGMADIPGRTGTGASTASSRPAHAAEEAYPPVYPLGCSGVITHVERLADGRYNIVLRGLERFRILEEDHSRSYRRARVEAAAEDPLGAAGRAAVGDHRAKLEALLAPGPSTSPSSSVEGRPTDTPGGELLGPATMTDEELVNALAQYLDFEPVEKQALLEKNCLRTRAESLIELLEIKMMAARTPGLSGVTH